MGHCHPSITEAAATQMDLLNINSRFLHDNIVLYANRLASTLPRQLCVFYFVNSGQVFIYTLMSLCWNRPFLTSICSADRSEANDLALRLAQQYTGNEDVIVLDQYTSRCKPTHHTSSITFTVNCFSVLVLTTDTSSHSSTSVLTSFENWLDRKSGFTWCVNKRFLFTSCLVISGLAPVWTGSLSSQAPLPDTYRGLYREDHPDPGRAYADTVRDLIEEVHEKGRKVRFPTVMTRIIWQMSNICIIYHAFS